VSTLCTSCVLTQESEDVDALEKPRRPTTPTLAQLLQQAGSPSPEPREKARTPPKPWRYGQTTDGSPNVPSPMSLYQLGIGSRFRRQVSSSSSRLPVSRQSPQDDDSKDHAQVAQPVEGNASDEEETSEGRDAVEGVQDSKDVLVERLNDLASRLSDGRHFDGRDINALHAQVDEMERVLTVKRRALDRRKAHRRFDSYGSHRSKDDPFWAAGPVTPGWLLSQMSDLSQHSLTTSAPEPETATSAKNIETQSNPDAAVARTGPFRADKVLVEAENLREGLSAAVASLQVRRQESEASSASCLLSNKTQRTNSL
jgi:hypothetical protein